MGKVVAVCISKEKGTVKQNVFTSKIIENFGLEKDAHAGSERQVSLLSYEKFTQFKKSYPSLSFGAFGENLLVSGFDFAKLPLKTRLQCNDVILEITQIGKTCHMGCEIRKIVGDCIMPREGVFANVVRGGVISVDDEMTIIE